MAEVEQPALMNSKSQDNVALGLMQLHRLKF